MPSTSATTMRNFSRRSSRRCQSGRRSEEAWVGILAMGAGEPGTEEAPQDEGRRGRMQVSRPFTRPQDRALFLLRLAGQDALHGLLRHGVGALLRLGGGLLGEGQAFRRAGERPVYRR